LSTFHESLPDTHHEDLSTKDVDQAREHTDVCSIRVICIKQVAPAVSEDISQEVAISLFWSAYQCCVESGQPVRGGDIVLLTVCIGC